MKLFELSVQPEYFFLIKKGLKTKEGRLAKKEYKSIKSGDILKFINDNHKNFIKKKVVNTFIYGSIEEALKVHSNKLLPGKDHVSAVMVYKKFYSQKDIIKFGVIIIEFK